MHEGLRHGFGIHVQEPYMIDGVVVSLELPVSWRELAWSPRQPRVNPSLLASFLCIPKQVTYSLEASVSSSVNLGWVRTLAWQGCGKD